MTRLVGLVLSLLLVLAPSALPAKAQSAPAVERVGWYNGVAATDVFVVGPYAYVGSAGGLQVFDLATPADPRLVTTVSRSGGGFMRLLALHAGRYLYARSDNGLLVFDLADPARPVQTELGMLGATGMAVAGTTAYVAAFERFVVLDVSSPTAPVELSRIDYPIRGSSLRAQDVAVAGQYAYVSEYGGGVAVYDVSDPRSLRRVGTSTPVESGGMVLAGNYLYVTANLGPRLRVLSLSDPTYPYEVASLSPRGYPHELRVANGRLYVSESYQTGDPYQSGGLRVYDVADPAAPRELAFYASESPTGVAVAGELVYLADQNRGLLSLRYPGQAQPAQRVRAYLPLVLNQVPWVAAPGTFVASMTIQNAGSAPAAFTIQLRDRDGTLVRQAGPGSIAAGATAFYYVPLHFHQPHSTPPLPAAQYAAVVSADQPVLAVVNVMNVGDAPRMAASYTGLPAEDAARVVYLPAVYNDYFGYDSTVTVQNAGTSPANVTVRYRDQAGTVVRTDSTEGVPAGGFQTFDSGRGGPFVGSAVVEADQPVAAVVHVAHAGGELAAYTGATVGGPATMPVLYKNYSTAGWTSSVLVQNLDAADAAVLLAGEDATIPPGATRQFYLANTTQPDGLLAPTTLQTGRRLAAVVMTRNAAGNLSAQNGLRRSAVVLHLPALYAEYSPLRWASSFVLQGLGSVAGTYHQHERLVGTFGETLRFGETRLHYQPNEGLPPEFNGSARLSTADGMLYAVVNNLALGQTAGDSLLTYESFQPAP